MTASVPIGEFSRLTHLSVKTLRHYHDMHLLAPARINPSTGYRRYEVDQVPTALLIGRLRGLDMPLAEVRAVLDVATDGERDRVIAAHLQRMERELDRTRDIVASLRTWLTAEPTRLQVSYRTIGDLTALAFSAVVDRTEIGPWCSHTYPRLYADATARHLQPVGPAGATYGDDFFTEARGAVTAYVPVASGSTGASLIGGSRYAVALHEGVFTAFDQTYAALGSHVAEHDTVVPGPIREIYLAGPGDVADPSNYRTEVCWPIA